jgi:hypothetical protein
MATLRSDLRTETRSLINEPVERAVLDTDLNRWLTAAVRDFTSRVQQYERIVALGVTANKGDYSLPTDILKLNMLRFQEKYRVEVVDYSKWAASTFYNANPIGIPSVAVLSPHDKILRLYAPPSVTSPATTLSGAHNSSVTTLTVASTTGFPKSGYLLLAGGEQVHYENISSTQFLLCRRGDADTTPGTYVGGEAVTEGRAVLFTCAIPPELTDDITAIKFPDAWMQALPMFMSWRSELKRQRQKEADFFRSEYMRIREEAAAELFWKANDGSPAVHDEESMGWYGQT